MWPWGHLAVAYLLYTLYTHYRADRPPLALPAIALAIGSQVPDLIDKPLAWTFGVLPGGRTLAHSVFFAALLLPAVYALGVRYDRVDVAGAFSLGHVSHVIADLPPEAFAGDLAETTYLFWPVLEQPDYDPPSGIIAAFLDAPAHMAAYEWGQIGLFVVGAVVWYRDGTPGFEYVRLTVERYAPTGR